MSESHPDTDGVNLTFFGDKMCGDLFGTVLSFEVHGVITVFLFVVDVFIFVFLLMGDRPGTIMSWVPHNIVMMTWVVDNK